MREPEEAKPSTEEDDKLVRFTSERLLQKVDKAPAVVEETVRDEFARRRNSAWIQTFVPIFAERAARDRLAV